LACRDKYMPKLNTPLTGFLVVEGFINVGNGSSDFSLSRASGLDSVRIIPETGAQLDVQSENGNSFPLTELGGGKYSVAQISVTMGQRYRLHIRTSKGKDYVSDYSAIKITPPIDSVNWTADNEGVSIFVTTHDPQNQSVYYQWQFEETWKYTSKYQSDYIYDGSNVLIRPDSLKIPYTCYQKDNSTNISIASSAKLEADMISQFPLTKVLYATSNKMINRYSILVKQSTLTKDWYEWKQKVKKNTEQLGSIFDAQPSETGGNIHCVTDPNESVIGFVACTTETEKRIFIDHSEILSAHVYTGYEDCYELKHKNNPDSLAGISFQNSAITSTIIGPGGGIDYVNISSIGCVDCRLKGGDSTTPAFWY